MYASDNVNGYAVSQVDHQSTMYVPSGCARWCVMNGRVVTLSMSFQFHFASNVLLIFLSSFPCLLLLKSETKSKITLSPSAFTPGKLLEPFLLLLPYHSIDYLLFPSTTFHK